MAKTKAVQIPIEVATLFGIIIGIHLIRDYNVLNLTPFLDSILIFAPGRYDFLDNYDLVTRLFGSHEAIAYYVSPVGYMFVHDDWFHLCMNMALFLAYGKVTAQNWGQIPWLIFFVTAGVFSAFFAGYISDFHALVGASGAISALIMAVVTSSILGIGFYTKQTAFIHGAMWILMLVIIPWAEIDWIVNTTGPISWETHLGGMIFGGFIGPFLNRNSSNS